MANQKQDLPRKVNQQNDHKQHDDLLLSKVTKISCAFVYDYITPNGHFVPGKTQISCPNH